MNNDLDAKIKHDLQAQSKELDALMGDGLMDYMKIGFASQFSWLMKVGYALAIILSVLMFYCGYQFLTVAPENQLFWGIWLIISFNAQVATKLWIFMHTNRNMLSRELRVMELRLAKQGTR